MIRLEVPLLEAPAEIDPEYENRHDLIMAKYNGLSIISSRARVVGSLANRAAFSRPISARWSMVSQSLPFKLDHARHIAQYDLPDALEQLREAIRIAASYEHSMYPDATYTGGSLTVRQGFVEPGSSQSGRGDKRAHRDGGWHRWGHIYMVSDRYPTEFFELRDSGNDGDHEGYIDTRDLSEPFVPQEYEMVFANRSSFHRSPIMDEGGERTFLRLVYEHGLRGDPQSTDVSRKF